MNDSVSPSSPSPLPPLRDSVVVNLTGTPPNPINNHIAEYRPATSSFEPSGLSSYIFLKSLLILYIIIIAVTLALLLSALMSRMSRRRERLTSRTMTWLQKKKKPSAAAAAAAAAVASSSPAATLQQFQSIRTMLSKYFQTHHQSNQIASHGQADHDVPLITFVPVSDESIDKVISELELSELISVGQFGAVYTCRVTMGPSGDRDPFPAACKVYEHSHRKHFDNELDIYKTLESSSLLSSDAAAVPKFYGTYIIPAGNHDQDDEADENVLSSQSSPPKLYLALELFSMSLRDCLQSTTTLSWSESVKMMSDVARGLTFLHSLSIAHRDINSGNVLVRGGGQDLRTCVISDFGFSLKLRGSNFLVGGQEFHAESTPLSDVGTVRYMAPEVLDGAVNLRDCEAALKQIDTYALALVMWEVASRCRDLYQGGPVPAYRPPYDYELAGRPAAFEAMRILVTLNKARPLFPACWKSQTNPATRLMRETIEDSWDHDAEARLTASCILQRIAQLPGLWSKAKLQSLNTLLVSSLQAPNPRIRPQTCSVLRDRNLQLRPNVIDNLNSYTTSNHHHQKHNQDHHYYQDHQHEEQVMVEDKLTNNLWMTMNSRANTVAKTLAAAAAAAPLQPHQGRNPCAERNENRPRFTSSLESLDEEESISVTQTSSKFEVTRHPKSNIAAAAAAPLLPRSAENFSRIHFRHPLRRVQNHITIPKHQNPIANGRIEVLELGQPPPPEAAAADKTRNAKRKKSPAYYSQMAASWTKRLLTANSSLLTGRKDTAAAAAILSVAQDADRDVELATQSSPLTLTINPPTSDGSVSVSLPTSSKCGRDDDDDDDADSRDHSLASQQPFTVIQIE